MENCHVNFIIKLYYNGILKDSSLFQYGIDDLYKMHFNCGNRIKKSISEKNDDDLQEFTDFLAAYNDHIDNVLWEMSEAVKNEILSSHEFIDHKIDKFEDLNLKTEIVDFEGVFGDRVFKAFAK